MPLVQRLMVGLRSANAQRSRLRELLSGAEERPAASEKAWNAANRRLHAHIDEQTELLGQREAERESKRTFILNLLAYGYSWQGPDGRHWRVVGHNLTLNQAMVRPSAATAPA